MLQSQPINVILQGDAKAKLQELESESVDECVSSPPYRGVRDYGVDGQLGLEESDDEYLDKLVAVYDEVKRVLKPYGSCYVIIGDTYNGNKKGNTHGTGQGSVRVKHGQNDQEFVKKVNPKIPNKSLLMIPERFAQKMLEHGWILRSKIIWHKPNAMPNSSKTRFTVDWEYVFMFVKNNEPLWWINTKDGRLVREKPPTVTDGVEGIDWDWGERDGEDLDDEERPESWVRGETIGKEPGSWWAKDSHWEGHDYYFETQFEPLEHPDYTDRKNHRFGGNKSKGYGPGTYSGKQYDVKKLIFGRIKRCVWNFAELFLIEVEPADDKVEKGELWSISTKGVKEAHFAVFPEELIETPIKAGCPEFVCKKCGMPRVRLFAEERIATRPGLDTGNGKSGTEDDPNASLHNSDLSTKREQILRKEIGLSDCHCNAGFVPGVVLDPFFGSGTTGLVALKLGRNFLGVELNSRYIQIAMARLKDWLTQTRLF